MERQSAIRKGQIGDAVRTVIPISLMSKGVMTIGARFSGVGSSMFKGFFVYDFVLTARECQLIWGTVPRTLNDGLAFRRARYYVVRVRYKGRRSYRRKAFCTGVRK
jgi:hypothetical protein